MSTVRIPTPYASIGRRTVALCIDWIILIPICAVGGNLVPIVGAILIFFLYAPLMESSKLKATIGKHVMGIQVVDLNGERITVSAAIVRNLLKFISTSLLLIGFVVALFTQKKQTLHDLLAQTLVVNGKSEISVTDAAVDAIKDVWNHIAPGVPPETSSRVNTSAPTTLDQLERLQALREKGAITEVEFETEKRKILG